MIEQLSYEYAPLFFGEHAPQFVKTHLINIPEEIFGYCMIQKFETFLYTEKFDAQKVIAEYNRLSEIYDAGIDASGRRMYLNMGVSLVQNKGIYMFPQHLISCARSDISASNVRLQYEAEKGSSLSIAPTGFTPLKYIPDHSAQFFAWCTDGSCTSQNIETTDQDSYSKKQRGTKWKYVRKELASDHMRFQDGMLCNQ